MQEKTFIIYRSVVYSSAEFFTNRTISHMKQERIQDRIHQIKCSVQNQTLSKHLRQSVSRNFPDWPPGVETANGKALCH